MSVTTTYDFDAKEHYQAARAVRNPVHSGADADAIRWNGGRGGNGHCGIRGNEWVNAPSCSLPSVRAAGSRAL